MLRTFFSLALVATITTLAAGCAVTATETIRADGSRTATRSVEWVPGPVYATPIYGYGTGRDHYGSSSHGRIHQPVVVYGGRMNETARYALVNGVERICYIPQGHWNSCGNTSDATNWSRSNR